MRTRSRRRHKSKLAFSLRYNIVVNQLPAATAVDVASMPWVFTQSHPLKTSSFIDEAKEARYRSRSFDAVPYHDHCGRFIRRASFLFFRMLWLSGFGDCGKTCSTVMILCS